MLVDVKVPTVGESITEGLLAEWVRQDGEVVKTDDPLFVLETDKVTMTINAEHGGRLKTLVPVGASVKIGQAVGTIDTSVSVPAPPAPTPAGPPVPPAATVPQTSGPPLNPIAGLPAAKAKLAAMAEDDEYSPAVRRMLQEYRLDPKAIPATGREGRLTKEDVVRYLEGSRRGAAVPQQNRAEGQGPSPVEQRIIGQVPSPAPAPPVPQPQAPRSGLDAAERQTRMAMTPLRARIAERLVAAKNSTAMLTTFNEADMTGVLAMRAKYREAFKAKYGVDLGFMSFFLKAAVDALMAMPQVNAQIQGSEIVQNHYYDIGVAVSSERGLVVPVVRDADRLSFAGVELAIADLARKVREKTITLAELSGGVFTVSNGGIYGNLLSTPILNPPQSAILGMHAIKKRPVVVDDQIVIRPMMYLAVSYDHRLVDGREAVTFLRRIVACIENPERMMLEI